MEFADWRYDGKEWDKERGSLNNVDSPDVQTDTSLSDLILNPDAVAMPPTIIAGDEEELQELDIANTGSHQTMVEARSLKDTGEPQLQNDTAGASNVVIAPAATQRTSTVDLNNMEQGSFTRILRRRTTLQVHVQVQLRPSRLELVY
jgi:hypothetical protein